MISKQLIWIAICIYHEARNQPEEGQIAVGHVILNRAEKRSMTAKEIILQPSQFSWANDGARPAIKDYASLEKSCEMAERCLSERTEGKNFFGADHYFADSISMPSWAKKMRLIKKVGNHSFFKA